MDKQIEEIWKPIKGFEDIYEISNLGNVKTIERTQRCGRHTKEHLRIPEKINGYLRINLYDGTCYHKKFIHRLVAEHFLSNPNNFPVINHKDENPLNNNVSNLEWCTRAYNNSYGNRLKRVSLTQGHPILQYNLQGKLIKEWHSMGEIERVLRINHSKVSLVCSGKRKTAGGFIWKYKIA